MAARARKVLADPLPVIHDLRHTHVSALIADGWDPAEVAARIGDTLKTTLAVYAHAFDSRRRGQDAADASSALQPRRWQPQRPGWQRTDRNGRDSGDVETGGLQPVAT